jgi:DNA-binding Xre family transcriptional regulator
MIRLKVKEIAQRKGISQTRLGQLALIDVDRMRRIWRYGDSEHSNLTLIVLERLARALQVEVGELIELAPDPEPPSLK